MSADYFGMGIFVLDEQNIQWMILYGPQTLHPPLNLSLYIGRLVPRSPILAQIFDHLSK